MTTARLNTIAFPDLPKIDESLIRERIDRTIMTLGDKDAIAEFYEEMRAQVDYRRKKLELDLFFETNFIRVAEAEFISRMASMKSKRLPSDIYDITLEQKTEKEYDASALISELSPIITKKELEKVVFEHKTLKTNGVEMNKLVRAYGPDSDVARIVAEHTTVVESGKPKLKIERKE